MAQVIAGVAPCQKEGFLEVFVARLLDLGCWGVAELRGQHRVAGPLVLSDVKREDD